jgi:hypothetical protein
MDKVAEWNGVTQSHGFCVEVYRDGEARLFVAQIRTSSPALIPQYIPGTPITTMTFDPLEEIKDEELDHLRELTKQRLVTRYRKILQFSEKSAQ